MKTYTSIDQLIETMKVQIVSTDKQAIKALLKIYNNQTNTEKVMKSTNNNNGVGFNSHDAKIMSSFAEYYNKHNYLSSKQMFLVKKHIIKYARQLVLGSITEKKIVKVGNQYICSNDPSFMVKVHNAKIEDTLSKI